MGPIIKLISVYYIYTEMQYQNGSSSGWDLSFQSEIPIINNAHNP